MTVNVKMNIMEIKTIIDVVVNTSTVSEEYRNRLRSVLISFKDTLEEESIRYDILSFEAYEIDRALSCIDNALQGGRNV